MQINLEFLYKRKSHIKEIRLLNLSVNILNGSYNGYKRKRGLPMYRRKNKNNQKAARKHIC